MTKSDNCAVTGYRPHHCPHCTGEVEREIAALRHRADLLASGEWIPAPYTGVCGCPIGNSAGDLIKRNGYGWYCLSCVPEEPS